MMALRKFFTVTPPNRARSGKKAGPPQGLAQEDSCCRLGSPGFLERGFHCGLISLTDLLQHASCDQQLSDMPLDVFGCMKEQPVHCRGQRLPSNDARIGDCVELHRTLLVQRTVDLSVLDRSAEPGLR
jgi:hypothetical protein